MNIAENSALITARAKWSLAVALGVIGALVLLRQFNPAEHSFYPSCWFHQATGLLCPGCGSLRAIHALTHGRWLAAAHMNALLVAGLMSLPAYLLLRLRERHVPPRIVRRSNHWWLWLAAGCLFVFGIVRNLPAFDWLRP